MEPSTTVSPLSDIRRDQLAKYSIHLRRISIYLSVLFFAPLACDRTKSPVESGQKFVIAVVGEGVGEENGLSIPHVNRAQGKEMWVGIQQAIQSVNIQSKPIYEVVSFIPYNDEGSKKKAKKKAREILANPYTLLVIGHASSGTTRAAAPIYAAGRIPLLMPIATSTKVSRINEAGSARFDNCFRLPANDDVQATALALTIQKIIPERTEVKKPRVYLIYDTSDDAIVYSQPLFSKIDQIICPILKRPVERIHTDFSAVASSIRGQRCDVVCFCGYGRTVPDLLASLRKEYPLNLDVPRPIIVLSDGCVSEDLDVSGFETFLTSPCPPRTRSEFSSDSTVTLGPSYESFGYDAVRLAALAIEECLEKSRLTRDCIVDQLSNFGTISGQQSKYLFDQRGENRVLSYYIYHSTGDTVPSKFMRVESLDASKLKP